MSVLSMVRGLFERPSPPAAQPSVAPPPCPVCGLPAPLLDRLDFNKSCEESRGVRLPQSGVLVAYHLCDRCGFCFAPQFRDWTFEEFEQRIYNDTYESVDPDYVRVRPIANAGLVDRLFGATRPRHLDYGGGSGLLSRTLREKGWISSSYDPFVDRGVDVSTLGTFQLVTAFEVFEHVPDLDTLTRHLDTLLASDGVVLFSTLLSDGAITRNQPLSWWYAAPRNGHISLFSAQSLRECLASVGLATSSASTNLHAAFRSIPPWAASVLLPK